MNASKTVAGNRSGAISRAASASDLGVVEGGAIRRRRVLRLGGFEYDEGHAHISEMTWEDNPGRVVFQLSAFVAGLILAVEAPVELVMRLDPQSDEEALAYEVMGAKDEVECLISQVQDYNIERDYHEVTRLTITGSK